ncbi:MAG TPA: LCP family protein [Solirubrobacteraceae bacterium]|jgi:LCP family protein required for cell wall assembly|nr:LCP family protein [Solirubrobacteraceae bacterium]
MPAGQDQPPQYTRYRARRGLLPRREENLGAAGRRAGQARRNAGPGLTGWRRWATRKRILLGLLAFVLSWLVLSLVLFLLSSAINRTSPPGDLAGALDPAGYPLTSANNILVLGSDRRQKNSKEPGAETTGPGRSDSIMLIRTGGGHAARLSIPRDTIVEIPGHGLQKINAAHAFGGPAESVRVIKRWLGIPINHVVEVNFENFPQLIDAMGGVDYTGGCVVSRIDGGFSRGGYTLRLPAGTHHLDGKAALALARTRENLCAPSQTDLQRQEHQQALFNAMKSRLLSPSSFFRLPLIAWNAPPAIISDMSGPTLVGLFGALAAGGAPPTRVFKHLRPDNVPGVGEGLTVSEGERQAAVAQFLSG